MVTPVSDPFEVFWSKGGTRITPANRSSVSNKLAVGDKVTITIKPPSGQATFTASTDISITLIYVRANYPHLSIDVNKIFKVIGQTGVSSPTTADLNPDSPGADDSWKMKVIDSPSELVLELECQDLNNTHPNHTFWLRVDIDTAKHDFIRNGSILVK